MERLMPDVEQAEQAESFVVVRNHEDQYSIWWADREIPAGWQQAGKTGSKGECLDYIDQVWTDMRPASLRKWMDENSDR
jgi:MbtH protein